MRATFMLDLFGVFHAVFDRFEGCAGWISPHVQAAHPYLEWFQIGISARLKPYKLPARRRYCPRRLRAFIGLPCSCGGLRGFFCWGNPKKVFDYCVCVREWFNCSLSILLHSLLVFGLSVADLPAWGVALSGLLPCLPSFFVSCLFTLVKYCVDPFDYLPAPRLPDQHKPTPF